MNRQKRHLTLTSITIMLALAILGCGWQVAGTRAVVADSHRTRFDDSHLSVGAPELTLAARAEAGGGNCVADSGGPFGGQIG